MKNIKKVVVYLFLSVFLLMINILNCYADSASATGDQLIGSTWIPQGQAFVGGYRFTVFDATGNQVACKDVYPMELPNTITIFSSKDIQLQGVLANEETYNKNCMYKYPEITCNVVKTGNEMVSNNCPKTSAYLYAKERWDSDTSNMQKFEDWAISNGDFSSKYLNLLQEINPSFTKEWLTTDVSVAGQAASARPFVFCQPLVLIMKETDYGWVDSYGGKHYGEIRASTTDEHGFVGTPTLYVKTDYEYFHDLSFRPRVLHADGSLKEEDETLRITSGQITTPLSSSDTNLQYIIANFINKVPLDVLDINGQQFYGGIGIVNGWPAGSSGGGGSGGGGGVPSNKADIIIKSQNVILYEDELSYVYSNVKFSIVKQNENINIVKKC